MIFANREMNASECPRCCYHCVEDGKVETEWYVRLLRKPTRLVTNELSSSECGLAFQRVTGIQGNINTTTAFRDASSAETAHGIDTDQPVAAAKVSPIMHKQSGRIECLDDGLAILKRVRFWNPVAKQVVNQEYWLPGFSLSKKIVFQSIKHFLGPSATVRPYSYQGREGYLVRGPLLTSVSYNPPTENVSLTWISNKQTI